MKLAAKRRQYFRSFEAKSLRSRSFLTQFADKLTEICGSTTFLVLHIVWFTIWILINTGYVRQIPPFDPFPFGLLTMVVSLEAIFLALFILVSQNRQAHISTIRDEVHMGVSLISEEEITKVLEILAEIRKEIGIKKPDPELEKMLERMDTSYLERTIIEQLQRANKPLVEKLLKELSETVVRTDTNNSTTSSNSSITTGSNAAASTSSSSEQKS